MCACLCVVSTRIICSRNPHQISWLGQCVHIRTQQRQMQLSKQNICARCLVCAHVRMHILYACVCLCRIVRRTQRWSRRLWGAHSMSRVLFDNSSARICACGCVQANVCVALACGVCALRTKLHVCSQHNANIMQYLARM